MIRVLAILGDFYHCSDTLYGLLRRVELPEEASVEYVRYPDPIPVQRMPEADLLILGTMGKLRPKESEEQWLTPDLQEAIAGNVRSGGGLLVLHAGSASHPADGPFRELVGGRFIKHPPQHPPVTVSSVIDHPVTRGVTAFTHPDEHYFMEIDEGVTPLLSTVSELGEDSGGWCREIDAGRACAIIPGHTPEMLGDPQLQRLVSNAVHWCLVPPIR